MNEGKEGEPRRVEVQRGDEWIPISMGALVVGDRFRMFEATGEPAAGDDGEVCLVTAPPVSREAEGMPGRWRVQVDVVLS